MDKEEINAEYNRTKFKLDVNDPELDCVTNLIYYGIILIIHANNSNLRELQNEFSNHCFTAIRFFEDCAASGNHPQDRVALVKDGSAWVNEVETFINGGMNIRKIDSNKVEHLYKQQRALISRCKIMTKISIEGIRNLTAQKLSEAGQNDGKAGDAKQETPKTRHSIDFRSVCWFGTEYTFTPNQAAAVKILWENWQNGTPDVGGDTLATEVESSSRRARDIFKGHRAFGSMISSGQTKGTYRLVEPDK